jgi:hypothetical protein
MLPEARVSTVKRGGLGGVNTARFVRALRRGARLMRAR